MFFVAKRIKSRIKPKILLFALYLPFSFYVLYKYQFLLRFSLLFPLLLPLFLLTVPKNRLQAVRDWSVFYLIAFLYDLFRGLIPKLNTNINQTLLVRWEKSIFGEPLPTIFLQDKLETHLNGLLGIILVLFYMTHFILPVLVLYFLWRENRRHYFFAVACLLVVSYLAFATFLVFPASPPWHASLTGFIPEVKPYLLINIDKLSGANLGSDLYRSLNSNPYAPFPSLHSAYPMLLFLISLKFFRRLSFLFLIITFVIPFALVAFGEHYLIDVFAGWGYAFLSYFAVEQISKFFQAKRYRGNSPPQSRQKLKVTTLQTIADSRAEK